MDAQVKALKEQLEAMKKEAEEAQDLKQQLEHLSTQKAEAEQQLTDLRTAKDKADEKIKELETAKQPLSVHVHRERPFPSFDGFQPDFMEWMEEVVRYICNLPEEEGLNFLMDHLTGIAREEVTLRSPGERRTPLQVFGILRATFQEAVTQSAAVLKKEFYNRTQGPGETLMTYSLELMKAFRRASQADGKLNEDRDDLLKGAFEVGIRDPNIQREVRRVTREKPHLHFTELRDEILHWVGREEAMPTRRTASSQLVAANSGQGTTHAGSSCDPVVLSMLQNQQKQIDSLTELVRALSQKDPGAGGNQKQPYRGFKCRRCRTDDHMWYRCPHKPNNQGGQAPAGDNQTSSGSAGTGGASEGQRQGPRRAPNERPSRV